MAAAPSNLKELYTADIRDLCSANDQMQKIVQAFSEKATDPKLKQLFGQSVTGIGQHTLALRAMMDADSGVVQNLPFLGYTGVRRPPACEGRFSTGRVSCARGGWPPRGQARWG